MQKGLRSDCAKSARASQPFAICVESDDGIKIGLLYEDFVIKWFQSKHFGRYMLRRAEKLAQNAIAVVMAIALTGCGTQADSASGDSFYAAAVSMESKPVIDYTVPQLTANVLADRLGYQAAGDKEASVKGRTLPAQFRLVDADTKETVYEGAIEKVTYNTESGLFVGRARFDGYEEPGYYYLECDGLGRSYTFPIVSELYIQLFEEINNRVLDACREQTASVSEVTALVTAYEWYPELFSDQDEDEIPDMLQDVAEWLQKQEYGNEESGAATPLFAALLAKFSYLYQKYDKEFATACLQRASAIYENAQNTMIRDAESFFALAELYRASGLAVYRNQIADYKSYFENSGHMEETEYLYGAMTYMVTRQRVDVELCNIFMDKMMTRGEELSRSSGDMTDPVTAKNNGTEDILKRANELLFVNYVLNSYQYHNVLADFMHYLGGKNLQSVMFYPKEGDCTKYILLLAQLAVMPTEDA